MACVGYLMHAADTVAVKMRQDRIGVFDVVCRDWHHRFYILTTPIHT